MLERSIIIIGAGPAGCAAAGQCTRLGVAPLLLDRTGAPGGLLANAWRIENYPGVGPTDGAGFTEHLRAFLNRFAVEVHRGDLQSIEATAQRMILRGSFDLPAPEAGGSETLDALSAECVILAPGTQPKKPAIPGLAQLEDTAVFYEVRRLLEQAPNCGQVAILGGGEAACDYALTLAQQGAEVTMLLRDQSLRARGRLARWIQESPAITVRAGVVLTGVEKAEAPSAGGKTAPCLRLDLANRPREADNTGSLEVDALLIAVGRRSAAEDLLTGLGLKLAGDIQMEDPRILLAGDARTGTLGQIGMAVGDGLAAAMAAVREVEPRNLC